MVPNADTDHPIITEGWSGQHWPEEDPGLALHPEVTTRGLVSQLETLGGLGFGIQAFPFKLCELEQVTKVL